MAKGGAVAAPPCFHPLLTGYSSGIASLPDDLRLRRIRSQRSCPGSTPVAPCLRLARLNAPTPFACACACGAATAAGGPRSPPEGHICPTGTGTECPDRTPAPRSGRETQRPAGARRPAAHCTPALAGGARGCGAGGCGGRPPTPSLASRSVAEGPPAVARIQQTVGSCRGRGGCPRRQGAAEPPLASLDLHPPLRFRTMRGGIVTCGAPKGCCAKGGRGVR